MSQWIAASSDFRERFNRFPFGFSHALAGHPLFELPRLAELGKTILNKGDPENFSHFQGSDVAPETYLPSRRRRDRASDVIARVAESESWVKLTCANEVDPEYGKLLEEIIVDLEELTGVEFRHDITWRSATVFIASPGIFTPYHIDHPPNFLLQIQGKKQVNLFDPADRSVLTEEEIEAFYVGDDSAAKYKDDYQRKAFVFPLTPGLGVHHPQLAPHWVSHGDEPSVALSVSFCLRSIDVQSRVYQVNHYLRRLGLQPTPLGRSPAKDKAKMLALEVVSKKRPENYRETVCSGIDRLRASAHQVRRLARRAAFRKPVEPI